MHIALIHIAPFDVMEQKRLKIPISIDTFGYFVFCVCRTQHQHAARTLSIAHINIYAIHNIPFIAFNMQHNKIE